MIEEKYFVGTLGGNPEIQAVWWCKSYKEALEAAEQRKQKFPEEADLVIIGRVMPTSVHKEKTEGKTE